MNTKEEAVLSAAMRLFSESGFHAVGVDTIVAESNVAKMTFYKYFPSKEILIERVLERRDADLRAALLDAVARARTPMGKLKAIFDWYESWFSSAEFFGCMFIKASEEFSNSSSKARTAAQAHKTWLAELMEQILDSMGVRESKSLSLHLMLVLDGLTVKLNMYDKSVSRQVRSAWKFSRRLVESMAKD